MPKKANDAQKNVIKTKKSKVVKTNTKSTKKTATIAKVSNKTILLKLK